MRYLIKRIGKKIDYMEIPKGVMIKKVSGGYQAIKGNTKGVVHKGYTLVEAINHKQAINKILPKD